MHELLAFDAVARCGSLTQAAESLCITVSAVSKQIASLELFLGGPMLQKNGRGIQLTHEGRIYWQKISKSLRAIETATFEARASDPHSGVLTLASVPTFLTKWLIPRLPDFRRKHPGITLSFSQHLRPTEEIPPGVDAAIRYGSGHWGAMAAEYIAGREFVAICAPAYAAAHDLCSAEQVLKSTLLHHEEAQHAWALWAAQHGAPALPAIAGPRFAQYSAVIQAAVNGLGVGLVPRILVVDELRDHALVIAHGGAALMEQGHFLCWNAGAHEAPIFTFFRDWILLQAAVSAEGAQPA